MATKKAAKKAKKKEHRQSARFRPGRLAAARGQSVVFRTEPGREASALFSFLRLFSLSGRSARLPGMSRDRLRAAALLALVLLPSLAACGRRPAPRGAGEPLPEFRLASVAGGELTSSDLAGK